MDLFKLVITFFIIANPVGNVPTIVGLIKDFSFERQKRIMMRECLFALLIAFFFQFAGNQFLQLIEIQGYTVSIAGGILLFLVSLQMIFPSHEPVDRNTLPTEPFVVPIATPLITGGGLMSSIMLYSSMNPDPLFVSFALLLAWGLVTPVMLGAPYIQKYFGRRGILFLEQLMGMLLAMISTQLVVKGMALFAETF